MAIQLKRGPKASLPILKLAEPAWTTDTGELFVGSASGNVKVFPVAGSGGNVDIVESNKNGKFIVNGIEIDVFDDTEIKNLLSSKASASEITQINNTLNSKANASELTSLQSSISGKANASDLTSLQATVNNKANASDVSILQAAVNNKADTSDLTALQTTINSKANSSDLTALQTTVAGKANASALTTLETTVSTKANRSELPSAAALETIGKLSDNGTNLLFNNQPIGTSGGSGTSEPVYLTKQSWNTSGTKTLSSEMVKFYIDNTGTTDLTFTINSIVTTVKTKERFEGVFDPFTQVIVTATSTFNADAAGLKIGSSNPSYSIKESFSGSAGQTKTFATSKNALAVSNDGESSLSYVVNGITVIVQAGEVMEKYFDAFTTVVFTSSVAYRVIAFGGFVASNLVDTTPPIITASPNGGLFNANQSVTLSANEAAVIYYTTNGATPTTSSSVYSTPISITADTTLKFFGKDTAGNESTVQTVSFVIDKVAPTVTVSPAAGTYASTQSVTLTASETATIYYTLDGSTPSTSSSVYNTPLSVDSTKTIKYFAKDTAGNSGTVQSALFTINVPDTTPPVVTASPNGGTFTSAQTVTLSANEPATIYYTTDGTTPTTSSSVYISPISIASTASLKFFGKDTANNSSVVQTVSFVINIPDITPPNPVTGLTAGTPTSTTIPISWILSSSSNVVNQEVAYSTDGSNFTVASSSLSSTTTSYSIINLVQNTNYTIRVVAINGAGDRSTAVTIQVTTGIIATPQPINANLMLNLNGMDTSPSNSNADGTNKTVTWFDQSGEGNHVTITPNGASKIQLSDSWSAAGFVKSPNMNPNFRLPFDPLNDYPATWEFIGKFPTTGAIDLIRIESSTTVGGGGTYLRLWIDSSRKAIIMNKVGGSGGYIELEIPTWDLTKYCHICYTITTSEFKIYLNGELKQTIAGVPPTFVDGDSNGRVLMSPPNGTAYLKRVRAYRKTFTIADVQNNYSAFSADLG